MFPNTLTEGLDDEGQFSKYVYLIIRCVDNQTRKPKNLGRSHLVCLLLVYEKGLGLRCHCDSCACGCCDLLVWRCDRRNSFNRHVKSRTHVCFTCVLILPHTHTHTHTHTLVRMRVLHMCPHTSTHTHTYIHTHLHERASVGDEGGSKANEKKERQSSRSHTTGEDCGGGCAKETEVWRHCLRKGKGPHSTSRSTSLELCSERGSGCGEGYMTVQSHVGLMIAYVNIAF
jgi:hypothetical protein